MHNLIKIKLLNMQNEMYLKATKKTVSRSECTKRAKAENGSDWLASCSDKENSN